MRPILLIGALLLVACSQQPQPQPSPSADTPLGPTAKPAPPPKPEAKPSPPPDESEKDAKPAPAIEAPSNSDSFAITAAQASAVGLPAIGFKLSGLKGRGWTRFAADRARYISLSGPPGGPLSFSITPYSDGETGPPTMEQLFKGAVAGHGGLDPIVKGKPEKVTVAGAEREAQAFRTGKSLATSNWCLVRIPSEKVEGAGLLMALTLGTKEDREPTCAHSLKSKALAPLIESFQFE
jgi:hypothetical protein